MSCPESTLGGVERNDVVSTTSLQESHRLSRVIFTGELGLMGPDADINHFKRSHHVERA